MLGMNGFYVYFIITFSVSTSSPMVTLTTYMPLDHPAVEIDAERLVVDWVVINSPVLAFRISTVHERSSLKPLKDFPYSFNMTVMLLSPTFILYEIVANKYRL